MIRQTMRSLALLSAGLLLAGGAWGQVLRQSTSDLVYVAAEYFGAAEGREIQSSGFAARPYVALTPSAQIDTGNVANITYRLAGATFSQTVSPSNLTKRGRGDAITAGLSVSVESGGQRGDTSVTFRVEATAPLTDSESIRFEVPNVQATLANLSPPETPPAQQVWGVAVTATIVQGVTNANPFPSRISGPLSGDEDANDDGDALDGAEVGSSPNVDVRVFAVKRALATSLGTGGSAQVALADRTKIASGGTADPSAADPDDATSGLAVGTLTIKAAADASSIWQLNGRGAVVDASGDLDSSLGGQIDVAVSGPFNDGDKVVFDLAGPSTRTEEPSGNVASTSLQLELDSSTAIVYVPGGTANLKPSRFTASAQYSFNNLENDNNLAILPSSGTISYLGINVEGYAYGVVQAGGQDTSFVRATCEGGRGCQVYLDCTDQAGENYFGGPAAIASGATVAWSSDAIAGVLGADDGWAGRGRCDFWSTASLAVQHMVRSGDNLVNNSAVVGRGLDENVDDDLGGALADICASVGSGDGEQDGADDGSGGTYPNDVDTECMPVDTLEP